MCSHRFQFNPFRFVSFHSIPIQSDPIETIEKLMLLAARLHRMHCTFYQVVCSNEIDILGMRSISSFYD